jgi:hypothetical protein
MEWYVKQKDAKRPQERNASVIRGGDSGAEKTL